MFVYISKIFRGILIIFLVFTFFNSFKNQSLSQSHDKIWLYVENQVEFLAYIVKPPDQRINHTKLTVEVFEAEDEKVSGKVLVSASLYPQYQYGDEILVNCKLRQPENFKDFSYDRYLAKSDIYVICSYPKIKLISRGNGDFLFAAIYKTQGILHELINKNLPEPQASMLSAILIGQRRGIPQDITEKFNITGTTHLFAISGLHITIIFTILMQVLLSFYISRKKSFYIVTIFLLFYLALIGFPPSAVRAGIMGWLLILAMYLGRLSKSTNSILLAASLMVLVNPKILRDDISFQLSFIASLGIIYFSPIFQNYFKKVSNFLGLRDVLVMSVAAYLATLPLVIFYFSRISLVGIFVNLLLVPVISYLVIFGFLAILLSLFFSNLSFYFFLPSFFVLTYILVIVQFFSEISNASLSL